MDIDQLYKILLKNRDNRELISDLLKVNKPILNDKLPNGSLNIIAHSSMLGYKIIVEELIKAGVDINKTYSSKTTALYYAVIQNNPEIAELLLNNNADISIKDNNDKTAFDYIYNIHDKTKRENIKKLFESKMFKPVETVKMTIDQLYEILKKNQDNRELISDLIKIYSSILNNLNKTGNTILILSVYCTQPILVELLLEANVDITIKDVHGKTAYDYIGSIINKTKCEKIRKLFESKMPKPVETVKPVELEKPIETYPYSSSLADYLAKHNIEYKFKDNVIYIINVIHIVKNKN
jgi:ankyrin repeat protein